jgi:hypothetical protein
MATHFGLNGRDCVKDYGELKTQKGSQPWLLWKWFQWQQPNVNKALVELI